MKEKTILLADDDAAIRTVLTQALTRAGFNVRATSTASGLWSWIADGQGDAVVTDVLLPDQNAFDIIPRIKKMRPLMPIFVMSAQNTMMTAIRSAELGAYDYLPKPFDLNVLVNGITKAFEKNNRPNTILVDGESEAMPIIGRSQAMQEIYRLIARLTQTDLTVMIVGESGTGKELVARALHDYSKRKKGPFVAVNMAAIPRDLIESELFGHERGSFTGAVNRMSGRFEQAEGGTLFLDEIGDMPVEAQTRLLRVLQQGEYTSVGGTSLRKTNVRIVAATHRDLRHLISQGLFREDLYFRLSVVPMRLPPLRERTNDIADLVSHFIMGAVRDGLPRKAISTPALERLASYRWPGNVRELENLIKRLSATEVDDVISLGSVEKELAMAENFIDPMTRANAANMDLTEYLENYLVQYFAGFPNGRPPDGLYEKILEQIEPPLLRACLALTNGNQLRAADLLGINRNTLRSKLRDRQMTATRGLGYPQTVN